MQTAWMFVDGVSTLLGWLALVAIGLMVTHVSLDVVAKYFFSAPLPATLTIVANNYMPMIVFLPLALLERRNGHIRVEFVTDMFSKRTQRHAAAWTLVLAAVICGFLAHATWHEAMSKHAIGAFQMENGLRLATWPLRFAAPLGYGLMCIVLVLKFVSYLTGRDAPPPKPIATPGGTEAA